MAIPVPVEEDTESFDIGLVEFLWISSLEFDYGVDASFDLCHHLIEIADVFNRSSILFEVFSFPDILEQLQVMNFTSLLLLSALSRWLPFNLDPCQLVIKIIPLLLEAVQLPQKQSSS